MVSKFVVAVRVLAFCVPVVLVLLACSSSGSGKANVRCVGQGTGVSCDVTHTEGSSDLEVCWDMTATCGNGVVGSASGICQVVSTGQTQQKVIPLSSFTGLGGCDSVTSIGIQNQTAAPL